MSKTTILIGNGFNYSLRDYIYDEDIKSQVNGIISLWNQFDELIKSNEKFIERIIEDLHRSFTLLSLLKPIEENEELSFCIQKIKEKFNNSFIKNLWEIVLKFVEQENKGFYKDLTSFLYNNDLNEFNPCEYIKRKGISIYTTNYDGIAEITLGYDGRSISLPDGFRLCPSNSADFVCFNENEFNEDSISSKLFHLHGSYKFFVYNTFTSYTHQEIKVRSSRLSFIEQNQSNLEPILVLNAPRLKRKQIKKYMCLTNYLRTFKRDLHNSDTLIVWGQSLTNDPHIEELITETFSGNNGKKIVIIDTNSNHTLTDIGDINIELINPEQIDFISILKGIFNDQP